LIKTIRPHPIKVSSDLSANHPSPYGEGMEDLSIKECSLGEVKVL